MSGEVRGLLPAGEPAPDFALEAADGSTVRLSDFRGANEVVVYFYPKDDTPGCTIEACTFRDQYEAFREAGAEVLGISSDAGANHRRFVERHALPFRLLSDPGGVVRKSYGVGRTLGLLPGRVTFVIDREGIVRHVFSSQFRPAKHVEEALGVLRGLRAGQVRPSDR